MTTTIQIDLTPEQVFLLTQAVRGLQQHHAAAWMRAESGSTQAAGHAALLAQADVLARIVREADAQAARAIELED